MPHLPPGFRSDFDVSLIQHWGSDDVVECAATTSLTPITSIPPRTPERTDRIRGLVNYLIEHGHGTPFEHCGLTVAVTAPIFVWREWHRHRIASYNEQSARYGQLQPIFYAPDVEKRPMAKAANYKAARPQFHEDLSEAQLDALYALTTDNEEAIFSQYRKYNDAIEAGLDPGLARIYLPLAIYSTCWVTLNLRALMHFLGLRTHEPTAKRVSYPLWEIEVIARQVEQHFSRLFPIVHDAWNQKGRMAP